RPIANNHAAERRLLVGRECFLPRFSQIGIAPHPAWVCVLQNRNRRLREFGNETRRRANIQNVVKRKFLPVELLEVLVEIPVKRGRLMRIFAVTKSRRQRQGKGKGR